jgi:hypothetical protein
MINTLSLAWSRPRCHRNSNLYTVYSDPLRSAWATKAGGKQLLMSFVSSCHFSQNNNMSSTNTFNALSECLKRENDHLKPHHIHIEIQVLNPHSSDEIALNLHIHGQRNMLKQTHSCIYYMHNKV